MTEHYGGGDDRLECGYRGAKAEISEDAVKIIGNNEQLGGGNITKEANANRKRLTRLKCGENIISPVIHMQTRQRPISLLDFVLDQARNLSAKRRDRRQKENAQDAEKKFLEAMQEKRVLTRAKFCTFGAGEAWLTA